MRVIGSSATSTKAPISSWLRGRRRSRRERSIMAMVGKAQASVVDVMNCRVNAAAGMGRQ